MSKRIIIYAPRFYGYRGFIKDKLEEKEWDVVLISHEINRLFSFFISFFPIDFQNNLYQKRLKCALEKAEVSKSDVFFVIKGDYLQESHVEYVKQKNPRIKTIMYQWDSIRNFDYRCLIGLFDKVFTFDIKDATEYPVKYLPLFYLDDILPEKKVADIDFLFIATNTPERYQYYLRLKHICEKNDLKLVTYLITPPSTILKDLFKGVFYYNLRGIRIFPVNRKKLIDYYQRSKIFVDITSPLQSGLSMRIIECYGMNKKLISSNKYITCDSVLGEMSYLESDVTDAEIVDFVTQKAPTYKNRDKVSLIQWINSIIE